MLVQKDLIQEKIKGLTLKEKADLKFDMEKELWVERPVTIDQFYSDRFFLGNSFLDSHNNLILYDFWVKLLNRVHPTPFLKPFFEIVVPAPIRSGKTYASGLSLEYMIYLDDMKVNPVEYYDLGPGTMIVYIFYSLDLNAANVNWAFARNWMQSSPYFNELVKISDAKYLPDNTLCISPKKQLYINIGSMFQHSISRAVHSVVFDEGNYSRTKGQNYDNHESLMTRVVGSFPNKEGIFWDLSSEESEGSFMETITNQAKNSKSTLIINAPAQWFIKGRDKFSSEEFQVFPGDIARDAFVVNEETKDKVTPDMTLLQVPMNFLDVFNKKLIKSLRDLANIRTASTAKFYKSKLKLKLMQGIPSRIIDPKNDQPIDIIILDEKDQSDTLIKYFEKNIDYWKKPMLAHCYRFMHIDIAFSGDIAGIGIGFASYINKEIFRTPESIRRVEQREYFVEVIFGIKAKQSQRIPLYKIVNWIVWMRDYCGYQIELISSDNRMGSFKLLQDLNIVGFNTGYLSVDKGRDPYEVAFEIVHEEKVLCQRSPRLYLENTHLIDDGKKIDHPSHFENGEVADKGLADVFAGTLFQASKAERIFSFNATVNQAFSDPRELSLKPLIHKTKVDKLGKQFYQQFYK